MDPEDRRRLDAHKDLIRRLGAINDTSDWDVLDENLTSDFRRHSIATTLNPEIASFNDSSALLPAMRAETRHT